MKVFVAGWERSAKLLLRPDVGVHVDVTRIKVQLESLTQRAVERFAVVGVVVVTCPVVGVIAELAAIQLEKRSRRLNERKRGHERIPTTFSTTIQRGRSTAEFKARLDPIEKALAESGRLTPEIRAIRVKLCEGGGNVLD